MAVVKERLEIVSEEDKKFCVRFWKVMPFFYKEELIKGAYPGFENEDISVLKNYIPHLREMYKGLVSKELLELREKWGYCIKNNIESPWDVLELFKPQHFFKRDKKEAFVNYLKHTGITDQNEIAKAVEKYLSETPPSFGDILDAYWQKHNTAYILWLDQLLADIPQSKLTNIRSKKSAILIAAMNETELEKVYTACQNAYGSVFENDMAFIVFHNFKDINNVTPEVWQSLKNIEVLGENVLVINGQVPDYFFDAPAKKVLVDLFLKCSNDLRINIFLLDADVLNLTTDIFKDSNAVLNKKNKFLVTSPEFDYDQNLKGFKYPVLKLVFDVRRDLDLYAVREEMNFNNQMAYGMFSSINLKTILLIGGLKPSTFVDGFLTNEIRNYGDAIVMDERINYFNYPLYPLSLDNHIVNVNSSRERISLGEGEEAFSRWCGDSDHASITTEHRFKNENSSKNIPEFSEFSESNIVSALNKAWLFIYKFRETEEITITSNEINHSKRLIRVLKNYGIEILDAKLDVVNHSPVNLKTGEGDFVIRKINQIKIIE
jgi:hypothetical protein